MRLITNEELLVVAGGEDGAGGDVLGSDAFGGAPKAPAPPRTPTPPKTTPTTPTPPCPSTPGNAWDVEVSFSLTLSNKKKEEPNSKEKRK